MAIVKDEGRERTVDRSVRDQRVRVFLIRHGQVVDHELFRFQGHNDVGLTETGRLQLEAVAERLAPEHIDEIYSSDLTRSRQGALTIARGRDLEPVVVTELREMHFGVFEGRTYREIMADYAEVMHRWRQDIYNVRLPEGESLADLDRRVNAAFDGLRAGKEGKTIAVVAHGGVNRVILARALRLEPAHCFRIEQDYGCLNVIDYYPEWTLVKLMNGGLYSKR